MVGPVIFDAVKRYLVYSGYKVNWVVNITDVDDKLINESNARGVPMSQLAAEMTADYMNNIQAMGVNTIDHFPRCTASMAEIIKFTQDLIDKGFAYEAKGDVYFEVSKDKEYGKLSHRRIEAHARRRWRMADRKRNAADFALWKSAKPGEPSWDSPWGPGRPGWHIECSAMSRSLLGETFDIHGGGLDLVFPHHENEIAQSECCHGKPMAKYWMHNGLMQASDEVGKVGGRQTRATEGDLAAQEAGKISKSKGSAPFRELLEKFCPRRSGFSCSRPITAGRSTTAKRESRKSRPVWRPFIGSSSDSSGSRAKVFMVCSPGQTAGRRFRSAIRSRSYKPMAEHRNQFLEAMDDDFNTGGGIATLFDLVRVLNNSSTMKNLKSPGKTSPAGRKFLNKGLWF